MTVTIKRIYEPRSPKDGYRILVDGLWPRGIKKETAGIDTWLKEIAPSTGLRNWFKHDPAKWNSFIKKYEAELEKNEALEHLRQLYRQHKKITLLYGAKDEQHNHAVVLLKQLQ